MSVITNLHLRVDGRGHRYVNIIYVLQGNTLFCQFLIMNNYDNSKLLISLQFVGFNIF